MYALLLTALSLGPSAAPQESSAHARWHPSDAGFFVEIPDAAGVCTTYDEAPLLRLLNDAEMQTLFKAIGGEDDTSVSVSSLAEWIGEALGVEVPDDELQAGVSSMSLSIRYANDEWGFTAIMETKSEALASQLTTSIKQMADEVEAHPLAGFEKLSGRSLPFDMWLTTEGERIAMGMSDAAAKGLAERMKGDGESLAGNPAFVQGMAKLGSTEGTPVLTASYTGSFPLRENLPDGPIYDAMAAELGAPMSLRTRFHRQRFETRIFRATPEGAEGEVLGHLPLKKEWLTDLPDDAMLSYATTIDGAEIAATLKSWIDGTPELSLLTEDFDVKAALDDLLAPLGPRLLVSMQPVMGLGFPPTYIWVDAEDSAVFAEKFEALAAKFGEKVPGIGARTRDYKVKNKKTGERTAIPYTSLTFPPELTGELGMFAPKLSFAQLEGRILFSTSSTALKGELKRLFNGEIPEPRDFLSRTNLELPSDAHSVVVFDWGILFGKLVGLAKLTGPLAGDALPFDLNLLPQPAVFERYLQPTVQVRRVTDAGVLLEHHSSFGLLTWGAALGAVAFRTGMSGRISGPPPALAVAPIPEEEGEIFGGGRSRRVSPRDRSESQTRASLRDIKAGIAIYKIEMSELPATMNLLVTPSEGYPKGYLGRLELPTDGWGRDFRYVKESSGYRLWSLGANGIDEDGAGDDIVP